MKTKVILLAALISVITLTVASTQATKQPKVQIKKSVTFQPRASKGHAMEDKNQF